MLPMLSPELLVVGRRRVGGGACRHSGVLGLAVVAAAWGLVLGWRRGRLAGLHLDDPKAQDAVEGLGE